jgi:hypothetical protein
VPSSAVIATRRSVIPAASTVCPRSPHCTCLPASIGYNAASVKRLFNILSAMSLLLCVAVMVVVLGILRPIMDVRIVLGGLEPGVKKIYMDRLDWLQPCWVFILLTAVLTLLWLNSHVKKRRRLKPGLCPKCGYDLRATPDRCPECGTVKSRTFL